MEIPFPLILLLVIMASALIIFFLFRKNQLLQISLNDLMFQKSSQSVKYGKMTEQWLPFTESFPFNSEDFKFLGMPVDGIVFDENKLVFVEFKTNKSSLNAKQKKIKELVENKKVEWFELRMN
ncbi:MAG TPA: Holliday junction resolvase-like protein [archaeon]|nr:Holliday junction resolvase-like protein [archaeon]